MNNANLQKAQRYHNTIRDAIMSEWDPIGIASIAEASDEYDSYIPQIYKMLIERASTQQIFDYLWWLETEHMGLSGDRQATLAFAGRLRDIGSHLE
jgi:hypothetical protein